MPRVALTGGAYVARSVIANAQRCVNLYPEINPSQESPPTPVTHYPTPGLVELVQPAIGTVRCTYRATNGSIYVVVFDKVYFIAAPFFIATLMGTIAPGTTPVYMSDNGITAVIVDGTAAGYYFTLGLLTIGTISDPAFYGATRVVYLDGFFIFNRPDTNQFYVSPPYWNGITPMDGTYIASKTGGPDPILNIAVVRGELWLVGQVTSEVWFNAGAADFPFQRQPGVFVEHGTVAPYSLIEADVSVFWLGRDRQGQCVVFMSQQYEARRISNHALEFAIQEYAAVSDAICFTYQQDGHTFLVLTFPFADRTWAYDLATEEWHERVWIDDNGAEHRSRANCCCAASNQIIVGDHSSGWIYFWALDATTDAGQPIIRRRGFPHIVKDGKRISYQSFQADVAVGGFTEPGQFQLNLRWSDTRGETWGDVVPLVLLSGATGQFYQSPKVWNLGMARDRVFELFWSFPVRTALQGAWIEIEEAET